MILCASAYTSYDLSLYGMNENMYKWGYFPEVKKHDIKKLLCSRENDRINILWVGRFLNWKHAEKAIIVIKELVEKKYNVYLNSKLYPLSRTV